MNNIDIKVYKMVFKEIFQKYKEAEDLINKKLDEISSHEKLSVEEVMYFLVSFLQCMFPC